MSKITSITGGRGNEAAPVEEPPTLYDYVITSKAGNPEGAALYQINGYLVISNGFIAICNEKADVVFMCPSSDLLAVQAVNAT